MYEVKSLNYRIALFIGGSLIWRSGKVYDLAGIKFGGECSDGRNLPDS